MTREEYLDEVIPAVNSGADFGAIILVAGY